MYFCSLFYLTKDEHCLIIGGMNIAENISRLFGGNLALSAKLRISPSYVCLWKLPHRKRGNNGLIPAKFQRKILNMARAEGVDLRPEDFFYPERLAAIIAANPDKYPPIKRGRRRASDHIAGAGKKAGNNQEQGEM